MELPAELRAVQDAADALYAQVQVVRQIRKVKENLSLWLDDYCGLRDEYPLPRKWLDAVEGLLVGIDTHGTVLRTAIPELSFDTQTSVVTCAHVTDITGCGVLVKLADHVVRAYQSWMQPQTLEFDEERMAKLLKAAIADGFRPPTDRMRGFAGEMALIQDHATNWHREWGSLKLIIKAEILRAAARRASAGGSAVVLTPREMVAVPLEEIKPTLDRSARKLYYEGRQILHYKAASKNQWSVLVSFDECKWGDEIDDPLMGRTEDRVTRVQQTVDNLNKKLRNENSDQPPIVFSTNGEGTGFRWRRKVLIK